MTEAVKRDLQLIKMRGYLDPKRFYKVRAGCAAVTQRVSSSRCHLYVLPPAGCRQQGSTQSVPGMVYCWFGVVQPKCLLGAHRPELALSFSGGHRSRGRRRVPLGTLDKAPATCHHC